MSEANFSFTTKLNGDLFCVRGNTAEEFSANLTAAVTGELFDYCLAFQEAARKATGDTETVASAVLGARPAPAPAPAVRGLDATAIKHTQAPAPAPAAKPQGTTPTCAHGEMQWKEGISGPNSKNPGTPYRMWACPSSNRNDQCKPVWVKS
jgi:hypothetical protein